MGRGEVDAGHTDSSLKKFGHLKKIAIRQAETSAKETAVLQSILLNDGYPLDYGAAGQFGFDFLQV